MGEAESRFFMASNGQVYRVNLVRRAVAGNESGRPMQWLRFEAVVDGTVGRVLVDDSVQLHHLSEGDLQEYFGKAYAP